MKIVVIGGTGLIGSKTVAMLRQGGHEVLAASPNTGVNTITGEGLTEAMAGTQVVVDLANSPSFEDRAVLEFFETSGRNLLAAEAAAGVRHHVALSARPSSWISSAASPIQVRTATWSGFRPACSSPSRRTTWRPSSLRWHWRRRDAASSRSPARNEHRSTNSSLAI
jgi:hypothetical protein